MSIRIAREHRGFTLIELLVVISIIGLLLSLAIIGLKGAREASRDAKRKADLELIRSGLEIYKTDCNSYPTSLGATLVGDDSIASCLSSNVYIAKVPTDDLAMRLYYFSTDGITYELCAALENGGTDTCSGNCGPGVACNYQVTNP